MSVITISSLGRFGRFGNQLFQYAFAEATAHRFGATLQTPPWIGQRLFGLSDPPISVTFPTLPLDDIPDHPDVDLHGYFQKARHLQHFSRARVKSLFTFLPQWRERYCADGKSHMAAHLRRGDYASRFPDVFCIISRDSYLRACDRFGLDRRMLVWCSEESESTDRSECSFLHDFFTMMTADVLLRANSTFSWWAGVLGSARVYSPVVGWLTGEHDVDFVEGNSSPITGAHDEMELPP